MSFLPCFYQQLNPESSSERSDTALSEPVYIPVKFDAETEEASILCSSSNRDASRESGLYIHQYQRYF